MTSRARTRGPTRRAFASPGVAGARSTPGGSAESIDKLTIGAVAERAGVKIDTLRYYERRGILRAPKRSRSGYREYPLDTVRLIRFIKRAQELGFTLEDVEELIALRRTRGPRRSQVRELAVAKLRDIDVKIDRLRAMRGALAPLVDSCACDAGELACPILEALDDPAPEAVR